MSLRLSVAVALILGLAAQSALAADEAQVLRQRAEQLAAADRCDEALPRARRAREIAPGDARAALVEGRCLLRTGRYREALDPLRDARRLEPSLEGVSTDLAQCHFHLDDLASARDALAQAEAANPDDARMHLYRGLVLLRSADDAGGAASLDRASQLDPTLAEVASLYAGRAWGRVRDHERAASALERARRAEPGSEWARLAERELEQLDQPYKRHVWARLRGGIEWDSNVALRLANAPDTETIRELGLDFDEEEDWRGTFEGEIGGEFLRDPDQSLGGVIGYSGNAHFDLHLFDRQYPWVSFWYDRRVDEDTWLRIQPFGGYAWLETDPFVIHGGALVSLTRAFCERFEGQVFSRVDVRDFFFTIDSDPVLADVDSDFGTNFDARAQRRRNRDGVEIESGLEGRYRLPSATTLRAGSAYQRYEAEGRDWTRHGSRSWISVRQDLPFDARLEVGGSFTYHPYDHRSSHLPANDFTNGRGANRRDKIWEGNAELAVPVTEWLALSARYHFTDNESNTRVFDYEQHVVGGYFTLSWSN